MDVTPAHTKLHLWESLLYRLDAVPEQLKKLTNSKHDERTAE